MQFHNHGYISGDPRVAPAAGVGLRPSHDLPDEIDVLIVGAGPAGMITAAQLAQFPTITTRLIERRPHRLERGRADGIQLRSVETFQAFGFASSIIDEAHQVTVSTFWKPDPEHPERIIRSGVGVNDRGHLSEFPTLIVNQARVLDYFVEAMGNAPARLRPDYGIEFVDLHVTDTGEYPVAVTVRYTSGERDGEQRTIRAKYVVGADGARSGVRTAIGVEFAGKSALHAWGVLDALVSTDFPDIRKKCAVQSHDGGSVLLVPREGGYLVRFYVDLGEVSPEDHGAIRETTVEETIAKANRIFAPYTLKVKYVVWHSVYEVAHRLTDRFDDLKPSEVGVRAPRVFIAGDACHTHSAKGGQGMNVSMQDGFNLAWKLGHVLDGRSPESLLETYSAERQVIAQDLINFDKQWSSLLASKPDERGNHAQVKAFYLKNAEFRAGFMTQYRPSLITAEAEHQDLAQGFPIGKRFASAPVVRVCDGRPMHLGHHARADGRWRVYAFADASDRDPSLLDEFAHWISESPESPLARTPEGADVDAWLDVKVIYQEPEPIVQLENVPAAFLPETGPYKLVDYEKVYAIDPDHDIFQLRQIDRGGVLVVVRPDLYVANVLPLSDVAGLASFFGPILLSPRSAGSDPDSGSPSFAAAGSTRTSATHAGYPQWHPASETGNPGYNESI